MEKERRLFSFSSSWRETAVNQVIVGKLAEKWLAVLGTGVAPGKQARKHTVAFVIKFISCLNFITPFYCN